MANQSQSPLSKVASRSLGITVLGSILLLAGVAVIALCVVLGVTLTNNDTPAATKPASKSTPESTNAPEWLLDNRAGNINLAYLYDGYQVTAQDYFSLAEMRRCFNLHPGNFRSAEVFTCLDRDKDGKLSDIECYDPSNSDFCNSLSKGLPNEDANVTIRYNPIGFCDFVPDVTILPSGMPCPSQAPRPNLPVCGTWVSQVRGAKGDKIRAILELDGAVVAGIKSQDSAKTWMKANDICTGDFKGADNQRAETAGTEHPDSSEIGNANGGVQRRFLKGSGQNQAGGYSNSGNNWKDDRKICNNIVIKSRDVAVGQGSSDASTSSSSSTASGDPEVEDHGSEGNLCQFIAFGSKRKNDHAEAGAQEFTGRCTANPCQGLNDGRCTPGQTGGRCVWYDKNDKWNPFGQSGCYTSPCNNPTPNTPTGCRRAPFTLALDNFSKKLQQKQADCLSIKGDGTPGSKQAALEKAGCNKFQCTWCKGSLLGCQNLQEPQWYEDLMKAQKTKGKTPQASCYTRPNSKPDGFKGNWPGTGRVPCESQKDKNCDMKFNPKLCAGKRSASCNCRNMFCSEAAFPDYYKGNPDVCTAQFDRKSVKDDNGKIWYYDQYSNI